WWRRATARASRWTGPNWPHAREAAEAKQPRWARKEKSPPWRRAFFFVGVPTGIRTPVSTVKGWCPRPLDDGDLKPVLTHERPGSMSGGARRDRTADLLHAMQALSQLSYGPTSWSRKY